MRIDCSHSLFREGIAMSLHMNRVLSEEIVAMSLKPSVPPKGLHLDTLLDYLLFKKADTLNLVRCNSSALYGSIECDSC